MTQTGAVKPNDPRLNAIKSRIGALKFGAWIMPLGFCFQDDVLIVSAPSAMLADAARNRFGSTLRDVFKASELRVYLTRGE